MGDQHTSLEKYLRKHIELNIIDHSLRATIENGKVMFYIHPDGKDGDTEDYLVVGYATIPKSGLVERSEPGNIRCSVCIKECKSPKETCRDWEGEYGPLPKGVSLDRFGGRS